MKKRIVVTKTQLQEYIERKKDEKIFNSILEEMRKNSKYLKNEISLNEANQTIIEKYKIKKQINSRVQKLLEDYNIVDSTGRII